MTSDRSAQQAASTPRRRRLFRGLALPSGWAVRSRRPVEEAVGHCPGCGGLIRVSAAASPVYRCGHCETPLLATVDGLDVETAVQSRLYRAIASIGTQTVARRQADD